MISFSVVPLNQVCCEQETIVLTWKASRVKTDMIDALYRLFLLLVGWVGW
jgi:hypothetical protein